MLWGLGRSRRAVPRAWASGLLSTFTQQLLTDATVEDVSRLLAAFAAVTVKPSGTKDCGGRTAGGAAPAAAAVCVAAAAAVQPGADVARDSHEGLGRAGAAAGPLIHCGAEGCSSRAG